MKEKLKLDTSGIVFKIDKIAEDLALNTYRKCIFHSSHFIVSDDKEEQEISIKLNNLFDEIHNDLSIVFKYLVDKKNFIDSLDFYEGEDDTVALEVLDILNNYDKENIPGETIDEFNNKVDELNQFLFILYTKTENKLLFEKLSKDSGTILH